MIRKKNDMHNAGNIIIIIGIFLILAGVLVKIGVFNFLGKLPGDFSVHKENFHFYFPLASSLIIGIIISVILAIIRIFRK